MRAEDVLPDHTDAATFEGVSIRKGTIAAFIANAKVVADEHAAVTARAAASRHIIDALPFLHAVGLFEVMEVRDPQLRAMIDQQSRVVPIQR